jgi:SpoVK/Ycf46/Vps4 family AAA+-type ATPase
MEAIRAAEARSKGRAVQADIEQIPFPAGQIGATSLPPHIAELVFDLPTHRRLEDLVLPESLKSSVEEFIYEFSHSELLRAHSIEPRHTLLLVGPPGNGKTSLSEAIASELSLPLLAVRYDAVVDSFLGETANRFRRLIDYASQNPSILFFDEFDAVGKERSDVQETGEIKRVVSSLLVQMDRLPSHSVVICATNHPELLDRAVWRRFEVRLEVPMPGPSELRTWFARFEKSIGMPVGITAEEFADCMAGESMSEVEAFTLDVRRKLVLSKGALNPSEAIRHVLARWTKRLRKNTQNDGHGRTSISAGPTTPRRKNGPAKAGKAGALSQKNLL